jgi:hypothetical protein
MRLLAIPKQKYTLPPENESKYIFQTVVLHAEYYVILCYILVTALYNWFFKTAFPFQRPR